MDVTPQRLRVSKKLLPGQPGTLKLSRHCGDALVCVRDRLDAQQQQRFTTVELIDDRGPVGKRIEPIVGVRVRYEETSLQGEVKRRGAKWDKDFKLWRMPRRVAVSLGLGNRIVEK